MARSFLQKNNRKIIGAYIFNLPTRITCPGSTKCCRDICYSKCQEVHYKKVVPLYRQAMLEAAQSPNFIDLIITTIRLGLLRGDEVYAVRIHESGDFFSQKYLDAWISIIKAYPSLMFWAYTKSYMLDFSEAVKLPNLVLRYSQDPTTEHYPKQKMSRAIVATTKPKGYITCPSSLSKGHAIQCVKDCRICLDTKKKIHFPPHGIKVKLFAQYERGVV